MRRPLFAVPFLRAMNRSKLIPILLFLLLLFGKQVYAESQTADYLLSQFNKVDLKSLKPHISSHYSLEIAEKFEQLEQTEAANQALNRILDLRQSGTNGSIDAALFSYARNRHDLSLAEKVLKEAEQVHDWQLDDLDLLRYRAGQKEAIENYPRGDQTFYSAMDLANTFIDLVEFEKAEQFVTGIKITKENDPNAVTGLVLERIADEHLKKGDREAAIRAIDKAYLIGGNLFYTGYGIEVKHLSMHGKLAKEHKKLARRGEAYRGHMARELLVGLIYELKETGHFQEAKNVAKHLNKDEELYRMFGLIAAAQVISGQPGEAFATASEIKDEMGVLLVRLQIANAMASIGEQESAQNLIQFAMEALQGKPFKDVQEHYYSIAKTAGLLDNEDLLKRIISVCETDSHRLRIIREALNGLVAQKQVASNPADA